MKWIPLAAAALCIACAAPANDQFDSSRHSIIGGYVDEETTGVVEVGMDFDGHYYFGFCSGTLIAPNLVLTARHCVADVTDTADRGVICGATEFTAQGAGTSFLVSAETQPPLDPADSGLYRGFAVHVVPGANDICGFDIALITLEGAGIPATKATPIVPRIDRSPQPGEEFSAVGYGLTDPLGMEAGVRMRLDGNTVQCTGVDCRTILTSVRSSEWLSVDADVCSGDSGGPALDEQGRVMGVASRVPDGCDSIIYGNVAEWKSFIIDTALEAASLGGYDPPFWTNGTSTPPIPQALSEAVGTECDSRCEDGLACFAESGKPPGICVPHCGNGEACPEGYACAESLSVCAPKGSAALSSSDSGSGCTVVRGSRRLGGKPATLAVLVVAMAWVSRRRRCVDLVKRRAGESGAKS